MGTESVPSLRPRRIPQLPRGICAVETMEKIRQEESPMFPNTNFPGAKTYWHMGKFYDWSETICHPMNHALHYGTSTFEGIRAYKTPRGTAIFRLPEHIDRFRH